MDKVKAVVMVVLCQDSSIIVVVTRHSSKEEAGLTPRTIFCSFSFEEIGVVGCLLWGKKREEGREEAPVYCKDGEEMGMNE
jgi:hypothetical protein